MNKWDRMESWHATLPPNRPDARNLAILAGALVSSSPPAGRRAAMLGCTPEYREVLRKYCSEVHLFDSSAIFKSISDSIVGAHEKEIFLLGDWLDTLPNYKAQFSFICSHFTHGNLEYSSRPKFFQFIADALTPDGIFFDVVFDPQKTYSLAEIRRRFLDLPINLITANEFNACGLFQAALSEKLGLVDIAACYEWLTALKDDQHLAQLIEYTKLVTRPTGVWHYSPGRGPETLGYFDAFEQQVRIEESLDNAFGQNCYILISRRRRL